MATCERQTGTLEDRSEEVLGRPDPLLHEPGARMHTIHGGDGEGGPYGRMIELGGHRAGERGLTRMRQRPLEG